MKREELLEKIAEVWDSTNNIDELQTALANVADQHGADLVRAYIDAELKNRVKVQGNIVKQVVEFDNSKKGILLTISVGGDFPTRQALAMLSGSSVTILGNQLDIEADNAKAKTEEDPDVDPNQMDIDDIPFEPEGSAAEDALAKLRDRIVLAGFILPDDYVITEEESDEIFTWCDAYEAAQDNCEVKVPELPVSLANVIWQQLNQMSSDGDFKMPAVLAISAFDVADLIEVLKFIDDRLHFDNNGSIPNVLKATKRGKRATAAA